MLFRSNEPHLALYQFEEIREAQIITDGDDRIRVLVVPWQTISEESVTRLKSHMADVLGIETDRLSVECVSEIMGNPGGKKQFVVARSRDL